MKRKTSPNPDNQDGAIDHDLFQKNDVGGEWPEKNFHNEEEDNFFKPKKKGRSTKPKEAQKRRGVWPMEEEDLSSSVIHYYTTGTLSLPAGTSLRSYLSGKLNCDPMRITKKYNGEQCLGKIVYKREMLELLKGHIPQAANSVESAIARAELRNLERVFRKRVASMEGANYSCPDVSSLGFNDDHPQSASGSHSISSGSGSRDDSKGITRSSSFGGGGDVKRANFSRRSSRGDRGYMGSSGDDANYSSSGGLRKSAREVSSNPKYLETENQSDSDSEYNSTVPRGLKGGYEHDHNKAFHRRGSSSSSSSSQGQEYQNQLHDYQRAQQGHLRILEYHNSDAQRRDPYTTVVNYNHNHQHQHQHQYPYPQHQRLRQSESEGEKQAYLHQHQQLLNQHQQLHHQLQQQQQQLKQQQLQQQQQQSELSMRHQAQNQMLQMQLQQLQNPPPNNPYQDHTRYETEQQPPRQQHQRQDQRPRHHSPSHPANHPVPPRHQHQQQRQVQQFRQQLQPPQPRQPNDYATQQQQQAQVRMYEQQQQQARSQAEAILGRNGFGVNVNYATSNAANTNTNTNMNVRGARDGAAYCEGDERGGGDVVGGGGGRSTVGKEEEGGEGHSSLLLNFTNMPRSEGTGPR